MRPSYKAVYSQLMLQPQAKDEMSSLKDVKPEFLFNSKYTYNRGDTKKNWVKHFGFLYFNFLCAIQKILVNSHGSIWHQSLTYH